MLKGGVEGGRDAPAPGSVRLAAKFKNVFHIEPPITTQTSFSSRKGAFGGEGGGSSKGGGDGKGSPVDAAETAFNIERTLSEISKPEKEREDELQEVPEEIHELICMSLAKKQPWYTRVGVFVVVFALVFGLNVFSMVYPSRLIALIVNMGPTTNQAGRRRFLTEAVVHYSRELALSDGYSRLTRAEATADLKHYLHELEEAHVAITRGGSKRISIGADARSVMHNRLMYSQGCPWRGEGANCSSVLRPDAATRGLHYLYSTFVDSALAVLAEYGEQYGEDGHQVDPSKYHLFTDEFDVVRWNDTEAGLKLLEEDPNIAFIIQQFDGDLYQGWQAALSIFYDETHEFLENAHLEFLTYFVVYIMGLVGLFYLVLFRRAVSEAVTEGDKARTWVHRVPLHIFTPEEIGLVEQYFGVKSTEEQKDKRIG